MDVCRYRLARVRCHGVGLVWGVPDHRGTARCAHPDAPLCMRPRTAENDDATYTLWALTALVADPAADMHFLVIDRARNGVRAAVTRSMRLTCCPECGGVGHLRNRHREVCELCEGARWLGPRDYVRVRRPGS